MIEQVQGVTFTVLSYVGSGWDYLCDGVQGCGNWVGTGIMRLLGA